MSEALREILPDQLWVAEMKMVRGGFDFGARMTVVRLADGGLFLHSPVALRPELQTAVNALGAVRALVAPSRFHYLHLPEFARAHPQARVYAAPNLRRKLTGEDVHEWLGDTPAPQWSGVLDQSLFRGSALYDEIDFYHRPSRTLILTDLLFNLPRSGSWLARWATQTLTSLGRVTMSRTFPLFARDRRAIRASLERILAWDFERIILSHGAIVESGGKALFRTAFARFLE